MVRLWSTSCLASAGWTLVKRYLEAPFDIKTSSSRDTILAARALPYDGRAGPSSMILGMVNGTLLDSVKSKREKKKKKVH